MAATYATPLHTDWRGRQGTGGGGWVGGGGGGHGGEAASRDASAGACRVAAGASGDAWRSTSEVERACNAVACERRLQ